MFQTEISHFLQLYSSEWLDAFMIGVSWTGDQTFLVGILCFIALGIDLKRGFVLIQIFLFTVIATDVLKTLFELPRPFFVDDTLMSFGGLKEGMVALSGGAAKTFLSLPPEGSITAFRAFDWKPGEFGLPSGHVSSAVALWGGLALVFRKNRLGLFAVLMIVLMAASRLYLARHFLADILAGFGLALFTLIVAAVLLNRLNWQRLFHSGSYSFSENKGAFALFLFGFILPVLLVFSGEGHAGRIAGLFAINMGLLSLIWLGVTLEPGNFWQRSIRVLLGGGLYVALSMGVKMLPLAHGDILYVLAKGFIPVFVLFFAAPALVSLTMREKVVHLNAR